MCHDLAIAVSPGSGLVATATNSGHMVFYKKDGTTDHTHDFDGDEGDQHIYYDDSSQRWFLSMLDTQIFGSEGILLYASTDAQGTSWTPYTKLMNIPPTHTLDDPNLVVTTDKVILSNDTCVYVLDKAAIMNNTAQTMITPTGSCGLHNNGQIWGIHARPQPSSGTGYFATMVDDQHIDWISVDGTAAANNVNVAEHPLAILGFTSLAVFGAAAQPSNGSIEACGVLGSWSNNQLWWSANETCAAGACARMFHVDTNANTETDYQLTAPNVGVFSAAAGIDGSGNMWAVMTESSSTVNPSIAVAGMSAAGVKTDPQVVVMGTQSTPGGTWGDFFECDQDTADGTVWCVINYGGPAVNSCTSPGKLVHITTK